jgi:serine/threonine protein kinase
VVKIAMIQYCYNDCNDNCCHSFRMAPECITAHEYSRETDSWAFGVLVFEVVCCCEPYGSLTPLQVSGMCGLALFQQIINLSIDYKVATKVANKSLRLELPDEANAS